MVILFMVVMGAVMKFKLEKHGTFDWRLRNGHYEWFCMTKWGAIYVAKRHKRECERYVFAKENAWEFEV